MWRRIVATLDVCDFMSSSNDKRIKPVSGQVSTPPKEFGKLKCVARSDGSAAVTICDGGVLNVGSGECLPKWPEGGSVPVVTTSHKDDLQADSGSVPVENSYGKHVHK